MLQLYGEAGVEQAASTQTQPSTVTAAVQTRLLKIMICGDSMSHGEEGDHTWRYRLWEWLRDDAPQVQASFVGR